MKKITLTAVIFFVVVSFAGAAKLTMVGVVDLTKIVSDYFQESSAWREIDRMVEKTEETIEEQKEEINQLEQQKLEALEAGEQQKSLQLEQEINKKQEYMKEYNRIMSERIENKKSNLLTSSSFSREILRAVENVADQEGISIVLRKKDPNILYYNYEVEITEKVLEYLRR